MDLCFLRASDACKYQMHTICVLVIGDDLRYGCPHTKSYESYCNTMIAQQRAPSPYFGATFYYIGIVLKAQQWDEITKSVLV